MTLREEKHRLEKDLKIIRDALSVFPRQHTRQLLAIERAKDERLWLIETILIRHTGKPY